mmetsp:Transcript_39269/g.113512  ORF Transcript_39269/g.113512 Transcript_39269/m.113512 type:complete len:238 (+) Transcript_39269:388-1101(+)
MVISRARRRRRNPPGRARTPPTACGVRHCTSHVGAHSTYARVARARQRQPVLGHLRHPPGLSTAPSTCAERAPAPVVLAARALDVLLAPAGVGLRGDRPSRGGGADHPQNRHGRPHGNRRGTRPGSHGCRRGSRDSRCGTLGSHHPRDSHHDTPHRNFPRRGGCCNCSRAARCADCHMHHPVDRHPSVDVGSDPGPPPGDDVRAEANPPARPAAVGCRRAQSTAKNARGPRGCHLRH